MKRSWKGKVQKEFDGTVEVLVWVECQSSDGSVNVEKRKQTENEDY